MLDKLLQSVFNAIVLVVGIDEIKSQKNIERLKRELRVNTILFYVKFKFSIQRNHLQVFNPLIDRLIDSLNCGDASSRHSSDLVGLAEAILCTENHLIQVNTIFSHFANWSFKDCFRLCWILLQNAQIPCIVAF